MRTERRKKGSVRALLIVLLLLIAEALVGQLVPSPPQRVGTASFPSAGESFTLRPTSFLMMRPVLRLPNE